MPAKKPQMVIEIDRNDVQPIPDSSENIASLNGHPGFEEILRRLRLHRAALRSKLETCTEDEMVELQQGIKWLGWLETFMKMVTRRKTSSNEREAFPEELAEFNRIATAITVVGGKK